jgi:hypothetical protein
MVFTQTDGSIEQQSANFQAALARKPDPILTTIVDDKALTPLINEARAKNVMVIAYNVDNALRRTRRKMGRSDGRENLGTVICPVVADCRLMIGPNFSPTNFVLLRRSA